MMRITCPHCHAVLLPDALVEDGHHISCPRCRGVVGSPGGLAIEPQHKRAQESIRRLRALAYVAIGCVFLSILAVLAGKFFGSDLKASSAQLRAWEIHKACGQYFLDHGQYPPSLEDLLARDDEGKGPYLKNDTVKDPWGKTYQYDPGGAHQTLAGAGLTFPDVYCIAPDGRVFGNWR
jgi:hypothetical protein